jgi:hypothetical protein
MLEIQKHCTLCDYQAIWINIHAKKQTNFINQKMDKTFHFNLKKVWYPYWTLCVEFDFFLWYFRVE